MDYKKSLVEIYFDVLINLIRDGSDLDFLTWTRDDENVKGGMVEWSSWFPKSWYRDFKLSNRFHYFKVGGPYPLSQPIGKISRTEIELSSRGLFHLQT